MVCYRSVLLLYARDDGVILISFAVTIRIDYSFTPEDDISRRNNNNNNIEEEEIKYKKKKSSFRATTIYLLNNNKLMIIINILLLVCVIGSWICCGLVLEFAHRTDKHIHYN